MAIKSKRTKSGLGGKPNRPIKHTRAEEDDSFPLPIDENEPEELDDNEISVEIRESIRQALKDSSKKISDWLSAVGDDNPARALAIFKDLTEYVVPRLQRSDSKLDSGSPVQVVFEGIDQYKEREAQEEKKKQDEKDKNNVLPITHTKKVTTDGGFF